MKYSVLPILLYLVSAYSAPNKQYKEHVVRCSFSNMSVPLDLRTSDSFDIWAVQKEYIDVRLTSEPQENLLRAATTECHSLIDDLDGMMQQHLKEQELGLKKSTDFFNNYQPYDTIVEKLHEWSRKYPHRMSFNSSIGLSYEGRDIPAVKISNSKNQKQKKAIWWNSGQHAREWIGPATVMYLIEKLLTSDDQQVLDWLDKFEFYITPIQNPDGYEYSRTPGHRFWRKNRRRNDDGSYGVDLNRNWDEHWNTVGSSSNPRSDVYHGTAPFSEPETKAVSDFVLSLPNRHAGIDFHSYSQLILRSWGWTLKPSKNEHVLKELGDAMSNVIYKVSGSKYTSERGAELYPAAGATDDWMTVKAQMVGYTIELRDTGRYGFALPPWFIRPVGDEIWEAMKYFVEFMLVNEIKTNE